MAFWSGDTLKDKLPSIVDPDGYDENKIDCAAYTLTMGPQYFVTPSEASFHSKSNVITDLAKDESFNIPSGQFAFLLTEEKLNVPSDVLALISAKLTFKRKGLINVSGFHVDPGYRGRLVFAVYNAGPKHVCLKRGEDLFLIWFTNLDKASKIYYRQYDNKNKPMETIPSQWVEELAGHIYAPMTLIQETRENKRWIDNFKWVGGITLTVVIAAAGIIWQYVWPDIRQTRQFEHRLSAIELDSKSKLLTIDFESKSKALDLDARVKALEAARTRSSTQSNTAQSGTSKPAR